MCTSLWVRLKQSFNKHKQDRDCSMAAQPAQQILPMHPPQPSTVSKVPLPSSSDWRYVQLKVKWLSTAAVSKSELSVRDVCSLEEDSILESALAELWDAPDR